MSGTDISQLIAEKTGANGTIPHTAFKVDDVDAEGFEQNVLLAVDGDTIQVGYVVLDPEAFDYWKEHDGLGEFRRFQRGDDPREIVRELEAEGKLVLPVECYAHGARHYSIAGTRNYPDRQWDVGLVGLFVPCDDVQERYRKAIGEEGADPAAARDAAVRDSNTVLDEYSKTVNGEVYGIVVETWRKEGDHVRALSQDAVWQHIGHDYAIESLREMMPGEEPAPSL